MCGIVGFSACAPEDPDGLFRAVHAIAHRGPDASDTYFSDDGLTGLGHTRLAIIDLSAAGRQPMQLRGSGLTITFNGEIYNYRELREELLASGAEFTSQTDTEVILHGYRAWREGVLERLRGIFALAIYDSTTGQVLVARDHLGVKPLYIAEGSNSVAFASEIKALAQLGRDLGSIDPVAIARYVSFLWCPGDRTPFLGVRKLLPGSALVLEKGRVVREWRFWDLPAYRPRKFHSIAQCATQLADCLDRVVARQMVADAPLGAFLSGGVDSTAVVAAARRLDPDITCYTIRTNGPQEAGATDDLPYARSAAKSLGVRLHEVEVDSDQMAQDFSQMVAMLDEPLADPACLNVLYISRAARADGFKVLLSGTGGDDVFSGYRRHAALAWAKRFDALPPSAFRSASAALAPLARHSVVRRGKRLLDLLGVDPGDRLVDSFRWIDSARLHRLLHPSLRLEVPGRDEEKPLREALNVAGAIPDLERCLVLEKRFFLADHNLIYTDKMSMAASVEVRVPLIDPELIEFAAGIPAEWKMQGANPKYLFKLSQRGRIPDDVIDRPKAGFGAPLRRWLSTGLRPVVDDLLSADSLERRRLFDSTAVTELRAENDSGRIDAAYPIFALACIEQWCRHFLDRPMLSRVTPSVVEQVA